MRHDWIFDMLSDLHAYASRNDLPGLAGKVEEALQEARREIEEAEVVAQGPVRRRAGGRMN